MTHSRGVCGSASTRCTLPLTTKSNAMLSSSQSHPRLRQLASARQLRGRTGACRPVVWRRRLSKSRPMRPKEGMYLAHGQGNPLLGFLPREHAHFGLRREHGGLHGDLVRMCRDIVRQDQYGCLAMTHEIARHSEDEVWVGAVHFG